MPESGKKAYLVSPGMIRILFIGSVLGMIALLLLFPLLASARPKGKTVLIDRATFQASLERATQAITTYRDNGDGTVAIDIDDAMRLVAERGVANPFTAVASAPAAPAAAGREPAQAAPAGVDGATVYATNCAACHQASGQGIPGAFPPLAGHSHQLYEASRTFLLDVILFGLQGQISVGGVAYNGLMPAWPQLSDEEIAAVANFITVEWDGEPAGFAAFTAEEVAAQRPLALNGVQVHELRDEAGLQ
jgi:mono/diheme cytochrome c family protein